MTAKNATDFKFENSKWRMTKIQNFKVWYGERRYAEKFFGYISTTDFLICAEFCYENTIPTAMTVEFHKFWILRWRTDMHRNVTDAGATIILYC